MISWVELVPREWQPQLSDTDSETDRSTMGMRLSGVAAMAVSTMRQAKAINSLDWVEDSPAACRSSGRGTVSRSVSRSTEAFMTAYSTVMKTGGSFLNRRQPRVRNLLNLASNGDFEDAVAGQRFGSRYPFNLNIE